MYNKIFFSGYDSCFFAELLQYGFQLNKYIICLRWKTFFCVVFLRVMNHVLTQRNALSNMRSFFKIAFKTKSVAVLNDFLLVMYLL